MTSPLRERSSRIRPPLLVLVSAILLVLALFHPASCESNEREGAREGDACESSGAKGQESFKSRLIHALRDCDRWRSSTGEGPSLSTRWDSDASARPHADSEVGSEKSSVQTETGGGETAEGEASNDVAEDLAEEAAKQEEETVEEEVPACGEEPEQTERETEEQDERAAENGGLGKAVGEDAQPGGGSSATEAPRGGWKRLRSRSSDTLRTQSEEGADPKAGLSLRGSVGSRAGGGDGASGFGGGSAGGTPPLRGMQKGSGEDLKVLTRETFGGHFAISFQTRSL